MQSYQVNSSEVPFIKRWLDDRGFGTSIDHLPEYGVLICSEDRPVAVGFVRKCEGNFAIFDSMVTNPQVHGSIRNEAMDVLFESLLELASQLEITRILGFSIDENTIVRSQKFGFQRLPYAVMSLNLAAKKAGN